jgi:hypothetical protein
MQRRRQLCGFFMGPIDLVHGRIGQQLQHVLGFDRGETAGEDRDLHLAVLRRQQAAGEDRAEQALVAGSITAFGGDIADLPADKAVRPARDGQVLVLVGGDEIRRDIARESRLGGSLQARPH